MKEKKNMLKDKRERSNFRYKGWLKTSEKQEVPTCNSNEDVNEAF